MKTTIKKKTLKKYTGIIVFAVVVLIAVLLVIKSNTKPGTSADFAQCLTDNGAVMYGAYWCSHCNAQKSDFGDSFEHINYVECADDTERCTADGIEGFPTWVIDGQKYQGKQSLKMLGQLTGCEQS
jgi:hypothetical protein